jgi:hypothetical protein
VSILLDVVDLNDGSVGFDFIRFRKRDFSCALHSSRVPQSR